MHEFLYKFKDLRGSRRHRAKPCAAELTDGGIGLAKKNKKTILTARAVSVSCV
jgi:hypothetical protein